MSQSDASPSTASSQEETADPTWPESVPRRSGRKKKANLKYTMEPRILPRRSGRGKPDEYYEWVAAVLPDLCELSTLNSYADRAELIVDPLMESKTAQLAALSADNTKLRSDLQLKDAELAAEKEQTKNLKEQVDELMTKVNEVEKKLETAHTTEAELMQNEDSETDDDKLISKKGPKCKVTGVQIDDFYVGISERQEATIPYYYDGKGRIKKFHGVYMCKGHINVRCFDCKCSARIENNSLFLTERHTRRCKGQPRAKFIAEQKQRRAKYVKTKGNKLLRYCAKERMSSDKFVRAK